MNAAHEPTRIEAVRTMPLPAADVFAVLCDPQGHVAIDSSGMLQSADGEVVSTAGDEFVVHMDREALGDLDLGKYDVTVTIRDFEPDQLISWSIVGVMRPADRPRLRLSPGAGRGWRLRAPDQGHVVVRLVRHPRDVRRQRTVPGDLRRCPQGDAGDPRAHRPAGLHARLRLSPGSAAAPR